MTCCSVLSKILLVLVNLLIFLLGVLFIAAGAIIEVGLDVVKRAYDQVLASAPQLVRESSWVSVGDEVFQDARSLQLDVVLGPAAIAFFVVGSILVVISIFGCCGACCDNVCMLSTYAAIIIFIILLEIVLVILLFAAGTKFENEAKKVMKTSIREHFQGIKGSNAINLMWNFGQLYFECCGAVSYEDFAAAGEWQKYVTVNETGRLRNVTLQVPLSCCRMNGTFPSVVPVDRTCAYNATDNNSHRNKGCYNRIVDFVDQNHIYLIIGGVILLVIEIVIVILAVVLLCIKRGEKDEDDDYKARVI